MSDSNDGLAVVACLLLTGGIIAAGLNVWGWATTGALYLVYVAAGLAVWRARWLSADLVCCVSIAALIATVVGALVGNGVDFVQNLGAGGTWRFGIVYSGYAHRVTLDEVVAY